MDFNEGTGFMILENLSLLVCDYFITNKKLILFFQRRHESLNPKCSV